MLVVIAIVMNRSIDDDDDRVIVLIVCIVVFSRLFIWIESWIRLWFWFLIRLSLLLQLFSSYHALMKFVCQWQLAEFVAFLPIVSSLFFGNCCSNFCDSFDGSFGSWNDILFFLFRNCFFFVCGFDAVFADSSCLCHLRFFSFLFGRDVGDNNIHNVRNVFVPFDADDVVIICEFCRTEVVISNRLWLTLMHGILFVSNSILQNGICVVRRFCLTLIRDICFEPNFWFKNQFSLKFIHGIPYLAYIQVLRTEFVLYSILLDIRTRCSSSRLFFCCLRFRQVAHACWKMTTVVLLWAMATLILPNFSSWFIVCDFMLLNCIPVVYFAVVVDVPPSSSSQVLMTIPCGYGTSPPINSSPSWEATRVKWGQLRSTGAGSTWRQVMWPRLEACWNLFSRHFSHAVPMLWCVQYQCCIWWWRWCYGDEDLMFAYRVGVVAMTWVCVGLFCNCFVWFAIWFLFDHVITCAVMWCDTTWHDMIWYGMMWYNMTWRDVNHCVCFGAGMFCCSGVLQFFVVLYVPCFLLRCCTSLDKRYAWWCKWLKIVDEMTVLLWRYWPPQRTEFDSILRIISVFVLKVLFQHLLMFWTVVSAPEMIFSVIFEIMVVVFVTFLRHRACLLKFISYVAVVILMKGMIKTMIVLIMFLKMAMRMKNDVRS